jgi:putative selenate reductase FAD-binding subunit
MFTARQYVRAASLTEAYELNQKRANRIVGGMQWMKMGKAAIGTAIDLSGLGLDEITEDETGWSIGAMVTLREIEQSPALEKYTGGAWKEALRHIVGVQFRNLATLGGTVAGRYGFSDPLTLLSVLQTEVCLYHAGRIPFEDYLKTGPGKDIVTGIHITREALSCHYDSVRITETDLPVLTCAVAKTDHTWRAAIGARPQIARTIELSLSDSSARSAESIAKRAAEEIPVFSNLRGSEAYRRHLIHVLVRRGVSALG